MAENPYAENGPVRVEQLDSYDHGQRVSLLAVSSVIAPIVCCIPLTGVLGMGLGASGLLAIRSAHGRLTGRPAAMLGLILGLMVTALQGALLYGGLSAWNFYVHDMAPTASAFVEAAHTHDTAAARLLLNNDTNAALTDSEITAFAEHVTLAYGEPRGAPTRAGVIFPALIESFKRTRGASQQGANINSNTVPVPLVLSFALDETTAWVFFDQRALGKLPQQSVLADLMIQLPDGSYAALRTDGPAANLATDLGATVSFTAEGSDDAKNKKGSDAPTEKK